MFQLEVDQSINLLKITYTGKVDRAQAAKCREQIQALLPELDSGFQLLADLSGLDRMDFDCAPEVQVVMDVLQEKGVSKIIRVIPDPKKDIGFKLMSKFHYDRDVTIVTCETLEDAVRKLST